MRPISRPHGPRLDDTRVEVALFRVIVLLTCLTALGACNPGGLTNRKDTGSTLIEPEAAVRNQAGDKSDETPLGPLDTTGELRGIKNPN